MLEESIKKTSCCHKCGHTFYENWTYIYIPFLVNVCPVVKSYISLIFSIKLIKIPNVLVSINSISEYQLICITFYCILIIKVEIVTQNPCTCPLKICYQGH